MSAEKTCFIDTNILLYLLSEDETKANASEAVVAGGGTISVQVLNEFVNVARKRLAMPWNEINAFLSEIRALLSVVDVTSRTHDHGCQLAERYQLSVYDAFIVASAIDAGCNVLVTEDMQSDQLFQDSLTLVNPYRS